MSTATELEALFPDSEYTFHVGVQRGEARAFFAPQDPTGRLLAERARWIGGADARRYIALDDEGRGAFDEFRDKLREWGLRAPDDMRELATALEPDVLLLAPDAESVLRLRGGALVFPTSWALEEKMGKPLQAIHAPVPGLNPGIGAQLDRMLPRLAPGAAWCRSNWGIAATDELNMHPSRALPAPALPLRPERLWLRVEHQALVALPQNRGLVFGIRLALHRLDEVVAGSAAVRRGLARALQTMTPELLRYKRIDAIAPELVAHLAE
ncbi:MAG: heme-dependent oxidative N-demethylase subunit alpha family protein [Opitutaceae bacterium]